MSRHFASVCVISTLCGNELHGLTATAVSSLTSEPPRLLVCVNKKGQSHQAISSSRILCVNVLSEDDEPLAKSFAGMTGDEREDCFADGEWTTLVTGAPAFTKACAVFDCRVAQMIDQSTHTIFVCDVLAVEESEDTQPLLYGQRSFHRLSIHQ